MAAKKKAAPAKKPAATKAQARAKQRIAVKLLTDLPPLDERRRRVYRAAFSDEACTTWGNTTKADSVLAEAERFIGALAVAVKKAAPTGYSINRLSWLTSLVNDLGDAVDADAKSSTGDARTLRTGAIEVADKVRKKLVRALMAASTGNDAFRKNVTDRNDSNKAAHALESTLTGLLQLAVRLRMSDDGEVLADDVGLTEPFLSSVSSVADSLREANEATYTAESGHDSTTTNLVEGRVLREMNFAVVTFRRAREDGEPVAALTPGPNLVRLVKNGAKAKDEAAPAPA